MKVSASKEKHEAKTANRERGKTKEREGKASKRWKERWKSKQEGKSKRQGQRPCSPMTVLMFALLILSPIPLGGEQANGCVVLDCTLELTHNRGKVHEIAKAYIGRGKEGLQRLKHAKERKYKQIRRKAHNRYENGMHKGGKTCTGGTACEKGKECKKKHENV